ncbi:ribonuclease H-like domain-containing protein [Tanacetum coccineum]
MTLIEAARTMLADSKLPTTFWAESVNAACYVQNRVLVVKPHNKTPYELFRGRTPPLSFMRPFGCHVIILNTLDYLGKFDGKSDEGFFIRYSMNSKAFRVYNIRTRKVEEYLHIRFLGDKPIIAGDGPKWRFDIDVLTKSMNYVPVVAGTNSNDLVGAEESIGAGHSSKETGSSQGCILMLLWKDGSLFDSSLKNASNDEPQPSSDAKKKDDKGVNKESGIDDQERPENSSQDINTVGLSINSASTNVNTSSLNTNIVSPTVTTAPLEATHKPKKESQAIKRLSRIESYAKEASAVQVYNNLDLWWIYHMAKETLGTKWSVQEKEKKDEIVQVYVDDIIFGSTKKKLCTEFEKLMHKKFQMSSMGELTFFLGLQVTQKNDGIFISQDKYVDEILKKFGFSTMKTTSTPMETSKPLLKDAKAEDVDVHLYRSMIDSLVYLTSSRPDIMFAVNLNWALGILRTHHLKLEDILIVTIAGAMQEANCSANSNYRTRSMWLPCKLLWTIKNPVFHSKTKHIEIRHHFIRDSNEKKLIQMIKIHTDQNVADLLRVLDLENTKTSQAAEIAKLKERVKKLERRNKSRTSGLKRLMMVGRSAQVFSSNDEDLGAQEDASKQGRKIVDLDADAEVTLVDEAQERNDDNILLIQEFFDDQKVEG